MRKVLLFSGGLDSYICSRMWEPDILLYCAIGHRYQESEIETIKQIGVDVTIDDRLFLGDKELDNAIIPLRNLMLIGIASYYGKSIGLGVLKDEINPDKSQTFRNQVTSILSTCYAKSYWSEGGTYQVEYPISAYDKVSLIKYFLKNGGTVSELLKTRSCYKTTDNPCGHCSACLKRYIAMRLNDIDEQYENDPHTSPVLNDFKIRLHTFSQDRYKQVVSVFPELIN